VNSENTYSRPSAGIGFAAAFVAALGALLIIGALAWYVRNRTQPAPLNQARIQERLKFLHEVNTAGAEALNNFAWQDQTKGLVRLPITNAMQLVVQEWKNPAVGRSNLLARLEKANPPPPPKAPEKPSAFE
jgi:hypothetical protein